jgi:nitrate/nitrite-specific signal transduction histidine kinase
VNPRHDTVSDFVAYVCEYAQTFLQPTAIQCLLEVEPDMPALDFDLPLRRSLLLAVKEAVTNAAKHSEATQLLLKIQRQDSGLNVIVEDDGKGFDPAKSSGRRNGIGNMIHERSGWPLFRGQRAGQRLSCGIQHPTDTPTFAAWMAGAPMAHSAGR